MSHWLAPVRVSPSMRMIGGRMHESWNSTIKWSPLNRLHFLNKSSKTPHFYRMTWRAKDIRIYRSSLGLIQVDSIRLREVEWFSRWVNINSTTINHNFIMLNLGSKTATTITTGIHNILINNTYPHLLWLIQIIKIRDRTLMATQTINLIRLEVAMHKIMRVILKDIAPQIRVKDREHFQCSINNI